MAIQSTPLPEIKITKCAIPTAFGFPKRVGRGESIAYFAVLAILALVTGVATGQSVPSSASRSTPHLPDAPGVRVILHSIPAYQSQTSQPQKVAEVQNVGPHPAYSEPVVTPTGARIITLQEAQEKAAPANNPMVRLGQLQVEVARQTRLGTMSTFFPQISSTFENMHFNKFMGTAIQIARPIQGGTINAGLPLAGENQTLLAVTATQPITPLFQLKELYKINLADENIARAKAGMPVAKTASKVEKAYYELLVAQRQLAFSKLNATETENKWLVASNAVVPVASGRGDEELIETSNGLAIATTKVQELTAALDEMLGWPPGTELQLVPPDPRFENITLREATDKALAANPEVIEAEQTVVKAQAAATIQKLAYVPTVAAMGGYAYNNNAVPLLPRDFSFIGIVATYNVFDFGKREHTIKGANAQAEMAEIALQLTKAKVAAAVKNSHFELERLRQLSELTRRLDSAIQLQRASYEENGAEILAAKKARVEAEMFQADLDYRQALATLKTLMGER
jgi:outer membrane protein TolC